MSLPKLVLAVRNGSLVIYLHGIPVVFVYDMSNQRAVNGTQSFYLGEESDTLSATERLLSQEMNTTWNLTHGESDSHGTTETYETQPTDGSLLTRVVYWSYGQKFAELRSVSRTLPVAVRGPRNSVSRVGFTP